MENPPGVGALPIGAVTASGGTITTPNAGPNLVVGSQTLAPGGPPITVSGVPVSLASDGNYIVAAGVTNAIARPPPAVGGPPAVTPAPAFIFGGSTITLDSATRAVINGQTIQAGGSPIPVSGTPISIAADGGHVVVGTSTEKLFNLPIPTAGPAKTPGPAFTLGSSTIYQNGASAFIVDGHTLAPGGPAITVAGTPVSLAIDATHVIVGSTTQTMFAATPSPPTTQPAQLVYSSRTLAAGGPAIIVSGTVVSLVSGGAAVVVGTRTQPIGSQSTGVDLGGVIWSVFGAVGAVPSSTLNLTMPVTAIATATSPGVTPSASATSSVVLGAASRHGRSLPVWLLFLSCYILVS